MVTRMPRLRADLDPEITIDALYGALYYRLLISGQPLTPGYADRLVDQLYPALAGEAPAASATK
jgi:hypothetical protein